MKEFGNFSENGKEYIITEQNKPRPLLNYMWNDTFLSGINHFGSAEGAYGNRGAAYIDPEGRGRCSLIRDGARYFYIADDNNFWNPGWFPLRTPLDKYKCTHGLGYTIIEGAKNGLSASMRVFVDDTNPCEIWTVTLKNETTADKNIKLTFAVDFALEGYERYSDPHSYLYADFDKENAVLMGYNDAHERPHDRFNAFITSNIPISGHESSKRGFLGVYGGFSNPDSIKAGKLSNNFASCEKMTGALMHDITVRAGETISFNLLLGVTDKMETAIKIRNDLFAKDRIEQQFAKLKAAKDKMCDFISVNTPEDKVNILVNFWLKQQVQLCAEAGRDTGKGFRDQLQDAWAIAAFNAKMARGKILETLTHQYSDGRCVRGWLPFDPHIYSDGPIWVALAVNGYLKETGDFAFLDEKAKFIDEGDATVWEHVLLSARYSSSDTGMHGLVLAHDGDWNDSLNRIGIGGKGVSVWTSIAICESLRQTADIARYVRNEPDIADEMDKRRWALIKVINENAWDGEWYLAAINDLGNPVGSKNEKEGKIYLNSQTWAILSGVAEGERAQLCFKAIDEYLDSPYGPLVLTPAYRQYNPNIGRLTGFVPGIWENGTPYCHSGAFKAVADCIGGRGDKAYETLMKIIPNSDVNPSVHSGCEPYALTNMYLGPENPRAGETLFAWVTGTAGWIFRLVTTYILGFHASYNDVEIKPCLPSTWRKCSYTRFWRGGTYNVNITNPENTKCTVKEIKVNGKIIEGSRIPMFTSGEHKIEVILE